MRPFRAPLVPLVPILGVIFCGYLMASAAGADLDTLFRLARLGLVIYFIYGRWHSRVSAATSGSRDGCGKSGVGGAPS